MLPLMYIFEIADILFFIKSLDNQTEKFDILNYVGFNAGTSRSSGTKLYHKSAPHQCNYELIIFFASYSYVTLYQ